MKLLVCAMCGYTFCSLWPRSEDKEAVGVLINCPAYYSVSAPKAELLNKIKDMAEEVNDEEEQVDVNEKKVKNRGLCSLHRKTAEGLAESRAPWGRRAGPCCITHLAQTISGLWICVAL